MLSCTCHFNLLSQVSRGIAGALDEYRFNDGANLCYQFVWHEFCDWYLEMVKEGLYGVAITCVQYLILSHAPVRTIGKVAGFGQSVVGIARIFGPAAGGLCLTYLGISSPFFLGAGLAGAAVIALLRFRQTIRMRYSTP